MVSTFDDDGFDQLGRLHVNLKPGEVVVCGEYSCASVPIQETCNISSNLSIQCPASLVYDRPERD